MAKKRKQGAQGPAQLKLWLPDREPLAGLPAPARAELLDVIAQLLLQTEIAERPPAKEDEDE